jgi:hypothetical protein
MEAGMRRIGSWPAVAMVFAVSADAHASSPEPEKKDLPSWRDSADSMTAIGVEAYGSAMLAQMDGFKLKPSEGDGPEPLRDRGLNLHGNGWLAGGGVRLHLQSSFGLRGGLGLGVFQLGGMTLAHDALPDGISVEVKNRPVMIDTELYIGKAFDARFFYPYVDVKASIDYVAAQLDLDIAGYGHVGKSSHHVWAFTVAPRVGAFIPINGDVFVHTAAQWGLTGVQRGGFFVGLGIWDD